MPRILVTGATGFIGRSLVRNLLGRGDSVHCLVRNGHTLPPGATPFPGDITSRDSLTRAVDSMDVVFHLAGATTVRHPLEYRRINAQGTRNLVEACAATSKPPLIVFLSSLAAAGPSPVDHPREERDPPHPVSHYGWSKLAGEYYLLEHASRLPATVLRAPAVFGPGDRNGLRLFVAAQAGLYGVPGSVEDRVAFLHVEDLVRALIVAAERGERMTPDDPSRGVYYVALEQQPKMTELGRLAGTAMGQPNVRTFALPRLFCRFWGGLIDGWVSITGSPRLLTSDKMREVLAGSWTCQTRKVRQQLGFTCAIGLEEGFSRTVQWYRELGWL